MLNPAKMDTMPPKPNLVINGEMPTDIAKKLGLEVKDFNATVLQMTTRIINVSTYAHMCWCVRARVRVCARSHACVRVELHLHKRIVKQTCNKRAQTICRLLVLEFCLLF